MTDASRTDLGEIKVTDRFNLSNRNFLITGGGRGIGFACAKAIAQLGGGVAVLDALDVPEEEFNTFSKRFNVKTCYVKCDVTNQKSLEDAFAKCVSEMGQLHGGLTAAGIYVDEPLIEADWENTQRVLNVNIMGTLWAVKLLAKHMTENKIQGSIVTIASLSGQGAYVPVQHCIAYNASKAAVKGMMGPLAGELGPYGIRINSISPGAIRTPMLTKIEDQVKPLINFYRDGAALGRLGVPEDLTPMVCYLLSDAAAFTTGADFLVTGGIHAGASHNSR